MTILTHEQVAEVLRVAGCPAGAAVILTAICPCESGDNVQIVQQGQPYATTGWGLWQITPGNSVPSCGVDDQLLDASANACAAKAKSGGWVSFAPWTTYNDGCYQQYMPAAEAAVAAAYALPIGEVRRQVAAIPRAKGAPPGRLPDDDWSTQVRLSTRHVARASLRYHASSKIIEPLAPKMPHIRVVIPAPGSVLLPVRRLHG